MSAPKTPSHAFIGNVGGGIYYYSGAAWGRLAQSFDVMPYEIKVKPILCTCGGDKTYGPEANLHVDWCDKAPPADTERSR